ncbi:MAG: hypothetical protein QM765_36450 [Myxococcales bacterium]
MKNRNLGRLGALAALAWMALASTGCSRHFSRVDFKYTSDSYLNPTARFVATPVPPESVGPMVRQFVAAEQGKVVDAQDRLPFQYRPTPEGDEAWKLTRAIVESEWQAFRENDRRSYDRIDRSDPRLNTPEIAKVDDPGATTSFLKAFLGTRIGQSERKVHHGITVKWKVNEEIDSALLVWWWPRGDGSTVVYARALPRMVKSNLEAAPGAWVQYKLWPDTTGTEEADVVKRLLAYLAQPGATPAAPVPVPALPPPPVAAPVLPPAPGSGPGAAPTTPGSGRAKVAGKTVAVDVSGIPERHEELLAGRNHVVFMIRQQAQETIRRGLAQQVLVGELAKAELVLAPTLKLSLKLEGNAAMCVAQASWNATFAGRTVQGVGAAIAPLVQAGPAGFTCEASADRALTEALNGALDRL